MSRRFTNIIFSLCLPVVMAGQTCFNTGYGEASLEPDGDFLSVALQGYGHPAQGRFSLEWETWGKSDADEPLSFTGSAGCVYALALNGDLYRRTASAADAAWDNVGATNPVVLLAGSSPDSYKVIAAEGDRMYGVSLVNGLYEYDMNVAPMSWRKIAQCPDAVAMAVWKGTVYVVSADGTLHEGRRNGENVSFMKISTVPGNACSMASFNGRLYVLLDNQSIWEYDLQTSCPWRMVAYLNGVTYKEPLRYIAVSDGVLYGLGFDNKVFKACSRTEGNISVRSLAVSDGRKTVVISALDLGAVDYEFTCMMKKAVADLTGIAPENQLVNVSHSHFTPVSKNWYAFGDSGIPDYRYLDKVKSAYVRSVQDAVSSMKKTRISRTRTSADIGYNRGLNGPDAVVDSSVDVISFDEVSGTGKHVVFEAACHPVFPNAGKERYTISANWPGTARNEIEAALGDTRSIFLQGCAGDVNPLSQDYRQTGKAVSESVLSALKGEMIPVKGRICVRSDSVAVPVEVMSREQILGFMDCNKGRTGDIEAQKNVRWAEHMLGLYDAGSVPSAMTVYYQIMDIGSWRIVALSREPVTEYAVKIKELWPDKFVTVLGYSDDVSSYLTSDVHLKAGNYESYDSFFWYGVPSHFPEGTIDRVLDGIKVSAGR